MVKLYVRDNLNGEIHEYGTDPNDTLIIGEGGALHYFNLENLRSTQYQDEGYSFVLENGLDPRESSSYRLPIYVKGCDTYIDIGGEGV